MRNAIILSAVTFTLLPVLASGAEAAPAPKRLERALVTTWAGRQADTVRSGTARSVMAGKADWAYSHLPSRCKTAAVAGLFTDPRTAGRPAALSTITTKGRFYGETLISTSRRPARPVIGPGCGRVRVKHDGRRITVRIVKVTDLPDVSGATVTAVKTTLSPSPWPHLPHPEFMLTVVRSGSLVMETYTDSADGDVETLANAFTEEAWGRARTHL